LVCAATSKRSRRPTSNGPRASSRVPRVPLMVGIDIVDVSRISRLTKQYGDKFLCKVFTEEERRYAATKRRSDESLAARFAAKEAFMKVQGRRLPWKDIEVCSGERGRPFILFRGNRFDGVSLSHERAYAVAVVTVEYP
jgi:holo-[acyl-carrier protein] synthase